MLRRATSRGEWRFPLPFFENRKKIPWFWNVLLVCIYESNSHLKCSFKCILEKNIKILLYWAFLLYVVHETFIELPLFQETSPAPKHSWLRAWYWCFFSWNFTLYEAILWNKANSANTYVFFHVSAIATFPSYSGGGGCYYIRTFQLIYSVNQLHGYDMTGTSVMKELMPKTI